MCKAAFLVLHGIGEKHFKNLKKHFSENGLSPCERGNQGRVPHHAITLHDARQAVTFLFEYAEMHAILLPGRVPGYRRTDLQVRSVKQKHVGVLPQFSTNTKAHYNIESCCYIHYDTLWIVFCAKTALRHPHTLVYSVTCTCNCNLHYNNSLLSMV